MLKNTVTLLLISLVLTTGCVTRKTTTPIIVSPEHTHTERTETVTPEGSSYSVKKSVRVTN